MPGVLSGASADASARGIARIVFVHGAVFGMWSALAPLARTRLGATEADFDWLPLSFGAGALSGILSNMLVFLWLGSRFLTRLSFLVPPCPHGRHHQCDQSGSVPRGAFPCRAERLPHGCGNERTGRDRRTSPCPPSSFDFPCSVKAWLGCPCRHRRPAAIFLIIALRHRCIFAWRREQTVDEGPRLTFCRSNTVSSQC